MIGVSAARIGTSAAARRIFDAGRTFERRSALPPWRRPTIIDVTPSVVKPVGHGILDEVALKHGVTVAEIVSDRRFPRLFPARMEAYYRIYSETPLSLPQVARMLGGRDHKTIHHGVREYCRRNGVPLPQKGAKCGVAA